MTTLPPSPSIENLKKQAKSLKKAWQNGDAAALARVQAAHPRYATIQPRLTDCQLVLARECGFESWRQLRSAVESAKQELPDRFVSLACLCYDDPHFDHRSFHAEAHEMLRKNPWLAQANIWCAAAAGNGAAVESFIAGDPPLANRPGPSGWAPLICACYSRVKPIDAAHDTYSVAKVLLDHGADPNPYTMKGNADERLDQTARRFTALTGLFGGGSTGMANQPRHPRCRELAELLLTHGADPADEAALEITQWDGAMYTKIDILLRHGLKPDVTAKRPNAGGITLMGRALSIAILAGDWDSFQMLLSHGARTGESFRGKTPWQHAMARGRVEMVLALEQADAPIADLDEVDRFEACVVAGDEAGARAMLARSPDLLECAPKPLVLRATGGGRIEGVKLALDLGFDPDYLDEVVALHQAAGGAKIAIARLLLARGASLEIRDPFYDGTPVGWADFFDQREMRDILLNEGPICLFDALEYNRLDRVPDILARDPDALDRPFAQCLTRDPKPQDWQTPLARMAERGQTEAVRVLLEHGARIDIANEKGFPEIAELLARAER